MARNANRPIAGEDDSLPVDEVLGEEPEDVLERGSAVGEARLARSTADILITAIIGGPGHRKLECGGFYQRMGFVEIGEVVATRFRPATRMERNV